MVDCTCLAVDTTSATFKVISHMMAVVTDNDNGTDNGKWEWEGGRERTPTPYRRHVYMLMQDGLGVVMYGDTTCNYIIEHDILA